MVLHRQKADEAGLELLGEEFMPKIVWRPFQLNLDMPIAGMNRKAYRTKKFGSWDRSLAMDAEVAAIGKTLGIEFNYDKVLITPNTISGHRLLWWAEQRNQRRSPLTITMPIPRMTLPK
jgi:predicted DsbA family dithiol-disulfide isomerase